MRQLLLLLLLSHSTFAQDHFIRDLVQDTKLKYSEVTLGKDTYDNELLSSAKYIQLDEETWKGAKKINELLKEDARQLNTTKFKKEFMVEFNKVVYSELKEDFDYCEMERKRHEHWESDCSYYLTLGEEFKPNNVRASYWFVGLCGHIAIGGLEVSFRAKRKDNWSFGTQFYQQMHYYDLNKGVEIDPSTIIDPKKKRSFYKLIKQRVPEHMKEMADSLDLSNGFPIFNGASFYYILSGSIDADTDKYPVLHVRLSYDEALQFLNPKGPFKSYLSFPSKASEGTGLMYSEVDFGGMDQLRYLRSMSDIRHFVEFLNGEQFANISAHCKYRKGEYEWVINFDKNGRLESHWIEDHEDDVVDDSIVFTYHDNGAVKSRHYYELDDVYDPVSEEEIEMTTLSESLEFDVNGNVIAYAEYESPEYLNEVQEKEIVYFMYFGDYLVADYGYQTNHSFGMEWGAERYAVLGGECYHDLDSDSKKHAKYKYTIAGDTTKYFRVKKKGDVLREAYVKKDGLVVAYFESGGTYSTYLEYNKDGYPFKSTRYRKTDEENVMILEVKIVYDSKNRPIEYNFHQPSTTKSQIEQNFTQVITYD